MVEQIIYEINKSLDNECYLSALALALTLPDICGKAMDSKVNNKERYINWYNTYVKGILFKDSETPHMSGEAMYKLRCSFLHQGNPNINGYKDKDNPIDRFIIHVCSRNPYDIYVEGYCLGSEVTYEMNIRNMCNSMCEAASKYYKENKHKFGFFNFEIINDDEKIEE